MIVDCAADLPRRMSDAGRSTTPYAQVVEGYERLSLEPGSAVLMLAPNSVEFLLHWIAALANGYVPCAVAPSTKSSVLRALRASLQIAAIVGPRLTPAHYGATAVRPIGACDAAVFERTPPVYEPFDVLLLTTGTSGLQTACVHTVESLVCNASMTNRALSITAADRQLVVLPIYHAYGLVTQSIGAIISGSALRIEQPPFNAARFAELIRAETVSVCGITPTIARDLLTRETTMPALRVMSIGGDRVSAADVARAMDAWRVDELYVTYGLTEAGPRVSVLPAHAAPVEAYDSVGRPFNGITTRIDAPDSGGVGQLLVKTPSACRRTVGTPGGRQPFTSDGFLETGDLFREDAAGYLRYVARKADIVIVNGEKLNTRSIDAVAEAHPDVDFARTTADGSNALVTRVWAKEDRTLDLNELRHFMQGCLRRHEVPATIVQERQAVFHK